jgi:hypothetical protein
VCASDLSGDLEHRPAARQLRTSLLAYAASKAFNPKVEVTETKLAEILDRTKPSTLGKFGAKIIECDIITAGFGKNQELRAAEFEPWLE